MIKKYIDIVKHYESCLDMHGDSHLGVDWPRAQDVETRLRVMLDLLRDDRSEKVTLLDLGCGLSHLAEYLQKKEFKNIEYSGLDLSEKFVKISKGKFPSHTYYCLDILTDSDGLPEFDYIVMNGIFTQKRSLSFEEMFSFLRQMVKVAFSKCRKGLAFNVMSGNVDWERGEAFHLPFDRLADFLTSEVCRDFVFRHDYGLYEYTAYVYRQDERGRV